MRYELEEIVYGNSLESLVYAFLNDKHIVYEGTKTYNQHDLIYDDGIFVDLKFLLAEKTLNTNKGEVSYFCQKQYLADFFCFHLNLDGLMLNHDIVTSSRIKEEQLEFVCNTRKDIVKFKKIYLFENSSLSGYNDITDDCYIFDYYDLSRSNYPFDITYLEGVLAKELYRIKRNNFMSFTKLKEADKDKHENSIVVIRHKIQDHVRGNNYRLHTCRFLHRNVFRKHIPKSDRKDVVVVNKTLEEICHSNTFTNQEQAKRGSRVAYRLRMMRLHLGRNGTIVSPLLEKILQQSKMQYTIARSLDARASGSPLRIPGLQLSKKG